VSVYRCLALAMANKSASAVLFVLCRLLRQRSSMLPTLLGRSGRQALLAWRAMHHTFALYNMGE
jgi:hypothetical protein